MATTHEIDALMIRIIADASPALKTVKDLGGALKGVAGGGRGGGGGAGGGLGFVGTSFAHVTGGLLLDGVRKVMGAVSSAVSSVRGAFEAAGEGIAELATNAVAAYARIEQAQVAFGVLVKDEAKGLQMVADLQALSAKTPLSMDVLQQSAKMLLQYGASGENIIPILQMLGDISGGNAQQMRHLTKAYADVTSVGRLLGTELRQFTNAGFNPLEAIAKKTGKTVGQLRDEMKHGLNPTINEVTQAMIDATSGTGRFAGLMDKMSMTLAGSWRRVESQAIIAMQEIGRGITKGFGLTEIGKDLGTFLGYMMPGVKKLADAIAAFAPLWNGIRSEAIRAWEWMKPVRTSLGEFFDAVRDNGLVLANSLMQTMVGAWEYISDSAGINWTAVRDTIATNLDFATFTVLTFSKNSKVVFDELGYRAQYFFENQLPKHAAVGFEKVVKLAIQYGSLYGLLFGGGRDKKAEEAALAAGMAHINAFEKVKREFEAWQKKVERDRELADATDIIFGAVGKGLDTTTPKFKFGADAIANMTKELKKFDSALYGSAEAISRQEKFADMIRATVIASSSGAGTVAVPGGGPPAAPGAGGGASDAAIAAANEAANTAREAAAGAAKESARQDAKAKFDEAIKAGLAEEERRAAIEKLKLDFLRTIAEGIKKLSEKKGTDIIFGDLG